MHAGVRALACMTPWPGVCARECVCAASCGDAPHTGVEGRMNSLLLRIARALHSLTTLLTSSELAVVARHLPRQKKSQLIFFIF